MQRHHALFAGLMTAAALLAGGSPAVAEVLYVTRSNNTITRIETTTGTETVFASTLLNNPTGIAVDTLGNVFAVNKGDNSIVKITAGGSVSTFVSAANGTAAGLDNAQGLTIDGGGNVYVASANNDSVVKFDTAGALVGSVSTGANSFPIGIAYRGGFVYAALANDTVVRFSTSLGAPSLFATAIAGTTLLSGVGFDNAGNLLVTSATNTVPNEPNGLAAITSYDSAGVGTLYVNSSTDAKLWNPNSPVVDAAGNVYVTNANLDGDLNPPQNPPLLNSVEKFTAANTVGSFIGNQNQLAGNTPNYLAITAVPEPSVIIQGGLMLLLGGATMGWRHRRARRAS